MKFKIFKFNPHSIINKIIGRTNLESFKNELDERGYKIVDCTDYKDKKGRTYQMILCSKNTRKQ